MIECVCASWWKISTACIIGEALWNMCGNALFVLFKCGLDVQCSVNVHFVCTYVLVSHMLYALMMLFSDI